MNSSQKDSSKTAWLSPAGLEAIKKHSEAQRVRLQALRDQRALHAAMVRGSV